MTKVENSRVQELEETVNTIDQLSQGGFSEIAAIASLALIALETPDGWRSIDDIVTVLETIRKKAKKVENLINVEAEQVGCNYKDEGEQRRWNARFAMTEEQGHE